MIRVDTDLLYIDECNVEVVFNSYRRTKRFENVSATLSVGSVYPLLLIHNVTDYIEQFVINAKDIAYVKFTNVKYDSGENPKTNIRKITFMWYKPILAMGKDIIPALTITTVDRSIDLFAKRFYTIRSIEDEFFVVNSDHVAQWIVRKPNEKGV